MRPAWLLITIVSAGIITGAFLTADAFDLTGNAVASFGAGVTVVQISVNTSAAEQAQTPTTGGNAVNFTIPLTYFGAGVQNITIAKPVGYENGFDWYIIEDGTMRSVTATATNLRWVADLGQNPVTLHFAADPPVVTVLNEDATAGAYSLFVRISADVHYTNVTASVAVDADSSNWYLVNASGSNVSAQHIFSVQGGIASWSNFSLSSQDFTITGDFSDDTVSRPSRSMRGGTWPPTHPYTLPAAEEPIVSPPSFAVDPLSTTVDLPGVGTATRTLTLISRANHTSTLSLHTTSPFLELPAQKITLAPGEERVLSVALTARRAGTQEARLTVSDGTHEEIAFFTITVPESPLLEQPTIISDREGSGTVDDTRDGEGSQGKVSVLISWILQDKALAGMFGALAVLSLVALAVYQPWRRP